MKGNAILIPGLGAPVLLMKPMGLRLKKAGYNPVYMRYPMHTPIEHHVERLRDLLLSLDTGIPFSIITHSYGSMICRNTYSDQGLPRPSRVVMIAPVNQGSHLAGKWYEMTGKIRAGRRLMGIVAGPVPFQILPERAGNDPRFPLCGVDVGVISLMLPSWLCGIHPLLDGPNDGTTLVKETYVPGMKDFIVLQGEHNTSLLRKDVAHTVIRFLDTGRFRG